MTGPVGRGSAADLMFPLHDTKATSRPAWAAREWNLAMKSYYSSLSSNPKQLVAHSPAEPVFVLCCIGIFCITIGSREVEPLRAIVATWRRCPTRLAARPARHHLKIFENPPNIFFGFSRAR